MSPGNQRLKKLENPQIVLDAYTQRVVAHLAQATICGGRTPASAPEHRLIELLSRYSKTLVHILTTDSDSPLWADPGEKDQKKAPKKEEPQMIDQLHHQTELTCPDTPEAKPTMALQASFWVDEQNQWNVTCGQCGGEHTLAAMMDLNEHPLADRWIKKGMQERRSPVPTRFHQSSHAGNKEPISVIDTTIAIRQHTPREPKKGKKRMHC